jgi:hypothetical protein
VGSARTATALLFDHWILDFSEPSIPYEIGCSVNFVEDDGGDAATNKTERLPELVGRVTRDHYAERISVRRFESPRAV